MGDTMLAGRVNIVNDIIRERIRQDEKWGGPSHDDAHYYVDWSDYIVDHTNQSLYVIFNQEGTPQVDPVNFRKQMVRVAALAMAAIESVDRKAGLCAFTS